MAETQGIRRLWTPGPWQLWRGPEYVGGGEDICIGAGKDWLANMDHRRPICKDVLTPGHRDDECDICTIDSGEISREQFANARLIAASPELFEALDRLIQEADESFYGATNEAMNQALAALAKALGGHP